MEILLDAIVRASLHGAVAIAAVWIVCRLFPRLPASLRCGLWWLACLKLLVALVWVEPVSLAVLPAEVVASAEKVVASSSPGVQTPGYQGEMIPRGGSESAILRPLRDGLFPGSQGFEPLAEAPLWLLALLGLWTVGLLLQLGLAAHQLAVARRIVRDAEPVGEPWIAALFAGLRERLGVSRAELLASAEVEAPQVSGAWQPRVLLPRREIGRLSPQELALTFAHELLHVRRGDLWLGWVPALAQRLFFFHPLVALAAREYALAREAACDAAVLRALDPAPEAYGRLLLRLGVTSRVPRLAAAGASPTFNTLKRRLEMLQQSADRKRVHRGWWGLLALLALAVLIPIQIVAAQAPPEPPAAPEAPEASEAVEPAPPAEPGEPVPVVEPGHPVPAINPGMPALAALPTPPAPPAASPAVPVVRLAHAAPPPPPPAPPAPPTPPTPLAKRSRVHLHDDGEPWVLLHDKDSVTMSGTRDDIRRARKHYSGKPVIWFERGGKSYVIQDAATVARAGKLFEPQHELGDRQSALGDQQSKLGDQQSRLGDEMSRHGDQMSDLASRQAGRDSKGLEKEMEDLGKQMETLGEKMEALGSQQEVLGRQQEELGRQQEKLAEEAEGQLKSLLDQAVAGGLAKEVGK